MEMLLLIFAIYIIPILIIWVIMYLLMKKGQTIEEFVEEIDCINTNFIGPMIMPLINIGFMFYIIGFYLWRKFKDWRK